MHLVCEPFIQLQNEKPVQIATSERAFLLCKTHNKKLCLAVATLERGETKRENEEAQELFLIISCKKETDCAGGYS